MRSGSTPERSRAARMAAPPSFTAGTSLNPPPNLPIGVRAPATITDEVIHQLLRETGGSLLPSYEGGREGPLCVAARDAGPLLVREVDDPIGPSRGRSAVPGL